MNFTKPNSATIRNTNSQWLREAATEAPVGRVAVSKTGKKIALPREDATESPVGRVAVPKTGQKTPSPRRDGSDVPVGWGAVSRHSRRSI